ncbi:hypothetical protein TrLO_g10960 [Triparma laevis f. longispina]|uniref:Uncharacterized protein n=1 Tax=Triparma laevis f. longispina TaxID=1714387 RepID=A0A9W7AHR4_9STRA|nr:hypothetical protein TrLO_g10960 [Triparma laevis f. longispina]
MFIVATSLGSFAVPRDETADRSSVSLTILLTTVAFKLQIGDSLQQISYLTLIDEFILSSIAHVIFVVLSHALFYLASKRNDIKQWNRFRRLGGGNEKGLGKRNLKKQFDEDVDERGVGI